MENGCLNKVIPETKLFNTVDLQVLTKLVAIGILKK